jgi:hypothetical protein
MENDLLTITDLAFAVIMVAQCKTGMEEHYSSAVERLGSLIVKKARRVQERREQAYDELHGYAYPEQGERRP